VLAFPLSHALALAGGKKGAYLGAAAVLVVRCIASMVFVYVSNRFLLIQSIFLIYNTDAICSSSLARLRVDAHSGLSTG
jgi:phage tail tape-measure protein